MNVSSLRLPLFGSLFATGLFLACSSPDTPLDGSPAVSTGATGGTATGGGLGMGGAAMGGTSTGGTVGGGTPGGATGGGLGSGGTVGSGGAIASGGSGNAGTSGGTGPATGGTAGTTGGTSPAGGGAGLPGGGTGGSGSSGMAGSGTGGTGLPAGNCNFTIMAQTADKLGAGGIPTVGVVNWSVDLANLTSAQIVFGLQGGDSTLTAPVDVTTGPEFRTLLLGMKGSKTYTFHIEASDGATSCKSADQMLMTGAVPNDVPRITRTAGPAAASQAKGFIISSSGLGAGGGFGFGGGGGGSAYAFIIDADGDIVWWAPAPESCSRALMSYDGQYMWMAELNVDNMAKDGGEVRRVSMDGLTTNKKIPGLSNCHHDLTILPDGKIACLSWVQQSGDQPSDLIESDYQGNIKKVVTVDSKIYLGGQGLGGGNTFHANSIHYHQADDSYTVSDRNPNLYVKINRSDGAVKWQFGGSCTNAPAPKCVPGNWKVNHGHDMLDDGTFLFFNNGQSGASTVYFYKLNETGTFSATMVDSYSPGVNSAVLGDVQRLPNGNTLITFSTSSVIHEIDPSKQLVQTINGPGGYAEWRETLYGPPPRF